MKFIITEEDKKHIKQLYGLITEQVVQIPNDILEYTPEQWKAWYDQNIDEGFIKGTLRKPVEDRRTGDKRLPLADGIRSITKTNEDRANFNKLLRFINTPSVASTSRMEMVVSAFEVAQNIADEVYSQWNDSLKKNMVLTITEKTEMTAGEIVGGNVEFPIDWNPDTNVQLYVNNQWEVSPEFINSFNQNVVSKITTLKGQFPQIEISLLSLDVQTSASRYRNTGQASELSFQELSGYRNNSAKDYIITTLQENGVAGTDVVTPTQQYLGGNGDGTTGPNPPEPNAYVDSGNVKMNTTPTEPRNQFGEPHSTPEEYNQYKYLKVSIKLKATLPQPIPEQESVTVFKYELVIDDKITPSPQPVKRPKPKGKSSSMNLRDKIAQLLQIDPEKCAAYD
jgi:hypothetical protein